MSTDFGYRDWSNVNFPAPAQEPTTTTSSTDRNLRNTTPTDINYRTYSERSRPILVRPKMWDTNGFYMNGPTTQPWMHAQNQVNAIRALSQSWSDPVRRTNVENFNRYISQYGHTNSPGILWGIAQLGIDPNSDVAQQILRTDAEEYQKDNRQTQPVKAGSPVANEEIEEAASLWEPLQFLSRNAFALLSSPMEAIQGSMRMIGGAVSDPDMDPGEFLGQITGATLGLVGLSPLTSGMFGSGEGDDNAFSNPWQQTDFGQTMALARQIGFDAFTSGQAGLDIRRAEKELAEIDPNFTSLPPDQKLGLAENYAQKKEYYSRPGWFVDETSIVGEAQRQRTFNTWAIPGPDNELTAWTIGRGIASATVGADSEAYGTMSGLIDAAAAIATDPITYIPAIGLPSKAVSLATRGSWKIGMEADKVRQTVRRMNEVAAAAQKLVAQGDEEAARRVAAEGLRDYLGAPPSKAEVDQVLAGQVFDADPTTLKNLGIEDVAEMTRAAREVELTTVQMEAAKPDKGVAFNYVRDARRNILDAEATQKFIDENVLPTGGVSPITPMADIWDEFLQFGLDNPNVKPQDFMAQRFGWNPETNLPTPENAEAFAVFNEAFELAKPFLASRKMDPEAITDFGVVLREAAQDTRSLRKIREVAPEKVDEDAAALMLTPEAGKRLDELQELDLSGVVVDGIPTADTAVLGAAGSEGGTFYLTAGARTKLNVVSASEKIPANLRRTLVNRLLEVAERPDMRLSGDLPVSINFDTLPGQVYRELEAATDARGVLRALLDDENLTYGTLLARASEGGFDAVLDDIMRTAAKKNRIDGITDIGNVPGRTWFGNNPRVNGYGISGEMRAAADQARNAPDPLAALAEMNIASRTTSILGYRALSPADLQSRVVERMGSGAKSRELLSQYRSDSVFNAYQRDAELKVQLDALNSEWADPVAKFKSVVGWHAGMRHHPVNGFTTDEKGVRAFLFGMGPMSAIGDRVFGVLADFVPEARKNAALAAGKGSDEYNELLADSVAELVFTTGDKLSPDLYVRIAENAIDGGGKSGLIDILAPRLGVDIQEGQLSKTIFGQGRDGKTWLNSRRTVMPKVHRMLGQMPTARKVNLQDIRDSIDNSLLYARYAGVDRDPTLYAQYRRAVGEAVLAVGQPDQGLKARALLQTTMDLSAKRLISNIEESGVTKVLFKGEKGLQRKKEIINAIMDSTALYVGGKFYARGEGLSETIAMGADVRKFVTPGGKEYIMPDAKLDAELADGFVGLPNVEDWAAGLRRTTLAIDRIAMAGNSVDTAMRWYNNLFRTSLLVFRGAYIVRNLAEMQVRMFLNGHESIFSAPGTILAMTVGDEVFARRVARYTTKRDEAANTLKVELGRDPSVEEIEAVVGPVPKTPKLLESFNRYKDTVLGTSFNAGLDSELAAANHVTEFWNLIRMSHSLTDPRVYNVGIKQGWNPVEYGSQNFSKGWANELIMLQRSDVVRLIVGKPGTRQFASMVDGTAGMDVQRQIVDEFMTSAKYRDLRTKLIAADAEYEKIFKDPEAVMEYLFRNQNSVFNQILRFTKNDNRLIDYLATGKLKYADGVDPLKPNSFTNVQKRISAFRTVLDEHFTGDDWADHFKSLDARVPFIETLDRREGNKLINAFFDFSNKIERIGAVSPEFRMAYWDKIAELAPSLRGADVPRAMEAARTTLKPIQNLTGVPIGSKHPAWKALNKAEKNGGEGFMTLDELHAAAMGHAAESVANLFYDATRRNNLWYALRVAIPFGQAWGNTLAKWTELGAKRPLNIYKAQKLFNALQEEQSNAIYEAGQQFGPLSAYGRYEPGYAPWEKDSQGGFFYQNEYGQTVFEFPFSGRMLGFGRNLLARANGVDAGPVNPFDQNVTMASESPVNSLNLALGGDNILPGFGPFVSLPLNSDIMPDNKITAAVRAEMFPFGEKSILENTTPAWAQKFIGGARAIPGFGDVFGSWTSSLYPATKNRNILDAMTILGSSGNYPDLMNNPETARRFMEDSQELAAATLLLTGLVQNVQPSTPVPDEVAQFKSVSAGPEEQTVSQYTLGLVNSLFKQYEVNNMGDRTAAVEEMIKDLGPHAVFALVGNWSGFTRQPTSQALDWAYENPDIAKAYPDIFPLFFPQGDTSDVRSLMWLRENTFEEKVRVNPEEAFSRAVGFLSGAQISRINSMENAGQITEDQAEAARDAVRKQYLPVDEAAGSFLNRTMELEQINDFVSRYTEVQDSDAGKAFQIAWQIRDKALMHTRAWTGDPDAGLGSKRAQPIRDEYFRQLDMLIQEYPDFKLLGTRLRKEWD